MAKKFPPLPLTYNVPHTEEIQASIKEEQSVILWKGDKVPPKETMKTEKLSTDFNAKKAKEKRVYAEVYCPKVF